MNSIAEVIQSLEVIVATAITNNDPRGYFAALYLQMTRQVKEGIDHGKFQNAARMEKLDVLFASRYLDAYKGWENGHHCTHSWQTAFSEAQKDSVSVVQHLLCGINTHINLDLGIAAAQTCPGGQISDLETDFNRINDVIGNLLGQVQQKLDAISWPMRFLDDIAGKADSQIANFSIVVARAAAWKVAQDLAAISDAGQSQSYINELDSNITLLGGKIIQPGCMANFILKPVKWFETGSVADKIKIIAS